MKERYIQRYILRHAGGVFNLNAKYYVTIYALIIFNV